MCILVWMKITQNRPEHYLTLKFLFRMFYVHFPNSLFQTVWTVKNGLCNARIALTEGSFAVHSAYDDRGSGMPSDPAEVTVLSCYHRTLCYWATSQITKIKKHVLQEDVLSFWVQSNDSNCRGFVKAVLISRAQRIHRGQGAVTPFLTALSVPWITVSMMNYRILQSRGWVFANSQYLHAN